MTSSSLEEGLTRALNQPGVRTAFRLLLEANSFARDLHCDPWEFAIELADFHAAGVSNAALRWLLQQGFIEHAKETTQKAHSKRAFVQIPNSKFEPLSCFLLCDKGSFLAKEALAPERNGEWRETICLASIDPGSIPDWDPCKRELRLANLLVKQFKQPATDQITVLNAFQEDGWPERIDDPLAPNGHQDSKRRLHNTINNLNRNQRAHLIRFSGNGQGTGIAWKLLGQSNTMATPKLM
jgi:hypothetical protein